MPQIILIIAGKMYFLKRVIVFIFLLLIASGEFEQIFAQCPGAALCDDAAIYCSLNDLDGISCNNSGGAPSSCSMQCSHFNNGMTHNWSSVWWAFYSQGGNATFTLTYGACTDSGDKDKDLDGLIWGLSGDCSCGEEIFCSLFAHPITNPQTFQVQLKPCKVYYLWIVGMEYDYCDFTIQTSGGGPPTIPPLGFINNISKGIIEPVCTGACDYKFFVDPLKGSCFDISYIWTLDAREVGSNSNEIHLDFPDDGGDFTICVTAFGSNPINGTICTQQGPKCAIVKVRPLPAKNGKTRTVCKGYIWNSQTIDSSGVYREQFTDNDCCKFDSIIEFKVGPAPIKPNVYYISCDTTPFIDKLGRRYSACKDHFEISLPQSTDIYKCDSSFSLTAITVDYSPQWQAKCAGGKVEHSPNISILKQCNVGESYKFNYNWYKKNDTTKATISTDERLLVDAVNEDYCLEVNVKVHLGTDSSVCTKIFCDTINEADSKNSSSTIALHYCDSAIVNGQTYTQSTQFTQQLKNVFGCDSINITDLIITKSSSSNLVRNSCDSAIVNNQVYTQSGVYKQLLTNVNNCDSILHLQLSIGKNSSSNLLLTACDSAIVNGQIYSLAGLYKQLLTNVNGCDSIINLDLTISNSSKQNFSFSACDSVVFNGNTYTKSGDYNQTYISANGCDSIVDIHVNIPNSNAIPYVLSSCDSANINGSIYTQSGNYTQLLKSVNGCDSTLNIDLTISKSNSFVYNFTSCDSAVINGQNYNQSGKYIQLLQNADHCDSTLNINLSLSAATGSSLQLSDCDSVNANNRIYTITGVYKQLLTNANGCDSILTIDFSRLVKSFSNLTFKSCDSVLVNGQTYKQSGTYTQTLINSNQCDSILNLDVAITKSNSSNISLFSCDSAIVNGQTYKQSGLYIQSLQNIAQCDSVLNIDLTIHKSSATNRSITACDSVIVNNHVYTLTGAYKQLLADTYGCDSSLNLQVTIANNSSSDLALKGCDSISVNKRVYTLTGVYKQLLSNTNGCDSSLTLDLTIKPGNPTTLKAGTDTSICIGEIIKLNGSFSGQANFIWHSTHGSFDNPNNLSTIYYPTSIGDEHIYLQAADDCKQWLDSLAVHILTKQIVQVTGDSIINPCKEITFTASGGTNYIWTPSSLIDCLDPACSKVKLISTVAARFTISSDGPCVVPTNLNLSLSEIQSDVYVPNVFSPNGDNINDVFLPKFNCDQVDYYNLQIFDRWGNLVFESFNKDKGWNGKYQDENMNPGVYPYLVQYQLRNAERKVKSGDVTLIR